jgi:hypothetical protein
VGAGRGRASEGLLMEILTPEKKIELLTRAVEIALQRLKEIQYQKASHKCVAFLEKVLELVKS